MITTGPLPAPPVAWLVAWRDLAKDWRRAILTMVLIMIPIAVLLATVIVSTSQQPTNREWAQGELGQAAARLDPIMCAPQHDNFTSCQGGAQPDPGGDEVPLDREITPATPEQLLAAVPAGEHGVLEWRGRTTIEAAGIPYEVKAIFTEAADPIYQGRVELVAGAWPAGDEVMVNRAVARMGVRPGSEITVAGHSYRVAGVVRYFQTTWSTVRVEPLVVFGVEHPVLAAVGPNEYSVFLSGGVPGDAERLEWNHRGIGVRSHELMLTGDPDAFAVDLGHQGAGALLVFLAGSLSLLMAILVAGAAMSIGSKRKERVLALLSATGARPAILRRVFVVQGILIGLVAAVVAMVLVIPASWGLLQLIDHHLWGWVYGFHLPWTWMLGGAVLAVVAGGVAALMPGFRIGRVDPAKALQDRHRAARPVVAVVAAGLLAVCVVMVGMVGRWADRLHLIESADPAETAAEYEQRVAPGGPLDQQWQAVGWVTGITIAVAVIAVLMMIPLVLRAISALSGPSTVSVRLAGRDLARARHRTVPVAAAIVAASMAAGTALGAAGWLEQGACDGYPWAARSGELIINPTYHQTPPQERTAIDGDRIVEQVQRFAEVESYHTLQRPAYDVWGETGKLESLGVVVLVPEQNRCPGYVRDTGDWRCDTRMRDYPQIAIGGAELVPALADVPVTEQMRQHLASGGVIAFSQVPVGPDGRVTFGTVSHGDCTADCHQEVQTPTGSAEALVVPAKGRVGTQVLMSPDLAKQLGLVGENRPAVTMLWLRLAETPDPADAARIEAAATVAAGVTVSARPETGPEDRSAMPWIVVGISAAVLILVVCLTTVLSLSERKKDEAVLGALGASPALRRRVAAVQAAWLAVVGAIFGSVLAMFLTSTVLRIADARGSVPSMPLHLLVLVLGVPAVAAGVAWLLTPSRAGLRDGWESGRPQTVGGDG